MTALLTGALAAIVVVGFVRDRERRDATSFVAAILVLALGLLAGAGEPALAVALGAITTLMLAMRTELHAFVGKLDQADVHAFARYAVIAGGVLPFLPNRQMGPLDAWNPFQLWLVIVLVTGFSFAGYVANRTVGARWGVLATAVIGGAYSSTAVTVSLAQRLGKDEQGPFGAGIALASAVMYLRVILLVALLSPSTLPACWPSPPRRRWWRWWWQWSPGCARRGRPTARAPAAQSDRLAPGLRIRGDRRRRGRVRPLGADGIRRIRRRHLAVPDRKLRRRRRHRHPGRACRSKRSTAIWRPCAGRHDRRQHGAQDGPRGDLCAPKGADSDRLAGGEYAGA